MRIEQLEYLIAIEKYHSMRKASEALIVSEQAISQALKELEIEINLKLLIRTNKGSYVTEAGKELIAIASNFFTAYEEMLKKYSNVDVKEQKKLTILFEYALLSHYDNMYHYFLKKYPQYALEYNFIEYYDLENILEQQSDNPIMIYLHEDLFHKISNSRSFTCNLIAVNKCLVAVSKNSPLANRKELSIKSIKNMRIVFYAPADKPSATFHALSKYHLEKQNNKFIYNVTTNIHNSLFENADIVGFFNDVKQLNELKNCVLIPLKETIPLFFCCISRDKEKADLVADVLKTIYN